MIKGGYYIKARQIQESEIAHAPPHVREIWDYLIDKANHSDNIRTGIKRGQVLCSLKEIKEALCWYVGYRKMSYGKSKCEYAMNWLRKRTMITTTKTTRGMVVTVCNYDYYQNPKNYETNNEKSTKPTRNQQPSDTIHKNGNNDKNVNILFNQFWDPYHSITGLRKTDKEPAFKHWVKLTQEEQRRALDNIQPYYDSLTNPKYCKKARTYLSDKSFNDEYSKPGANGQGMLQTEQERLIQAMGA